MRPNYSAPNRGSRPIDDLAAGRISEPSAEKKSPGPAAEETTRPAYERADEELVQLSEPEGDSTWCWISCYDAAKPLLDLLRDRGGV